MVPGFDIFPETGLSLLIAGGGTGGHLFPGIAVAEALLARFPASRVLFVNAGRPLERRILARGNWSYHAIKVEGIKGRGRLAQLRAATRLPGALGQAITIIRCHKPDVVLGVGGYSSGPVVMAAWLLGVPTALHEQNLLPGVTNKVLSRLVDRIYLSFEQSRQVFAPDKSLVTGNPVRAQIAAAASKHSGRLREGPPNLLVVGGSQGAHRINMAMVEGARQLAGIDGLRIVHQTGTADLEAVRRAYLKANLNFEAAPFFDAMAERYLAAHLVICRAGASTVAELTALGKAALLIPFPHATDDHQTFNARSLESAGAAEVIAEKDLNGRDLAERITALLNNRSKLAGMAKAARAMANLRAAEDMVNDLLDLVKSKKTSKAKNLKQSGNRIFGK